MLLLLPYTEYLRRMIEPRNVADIVFVFLLVYAVLKLLRGTRAAHFSLRQRKLYGSMSTISRRSDGGFGSEPSQARK